MTNDKAFAAWMDAIEAEIPCSLATIMQEEVAGNYSAVRLFKNIEGELVSTMHHQTLLAEIEQKMDEKLVVTNPLAETVEVEVDNQTYQVFIDVHIPQVEIMIFGAGHDAVPVANYSVSLGYKTTVIDAREHFNTEALFPNTNRIIARPEAYNEKVKITKQTYIIVMNHHIEKDRDTLAFVLKSNAPYVGVLGPRSRRERMMDQLADDGITFTAADLEKMYNPVGLDIGAESPEEIAISILAEIVAVRNGHQGGFLHGNEKIHKYSSKYDPNLA